MLTAGAVLLAGTFAAHQAPLELVVSLLLLASAVLAGLVALGDMRHRPVAIGIAAVSSAQIARALLHAYVLHGGPYSGWTRAAFHVEEGLYLLSTVMVPLMVMAVLMDLPPGPGVGRWARGALWTAYGGAWAGLIGGYPAIRADVLRQVYLVAELVALLVSCVAIASWVRRRGWRLESGPRWYSWTTVLMIVVADLVLLVGGAWRYGLFGEAYVVQQAGLLALWGGVAVVQGLALVLVSQR